MGQSLICEERSKQQPVEINFQLSKFVDNYEYQLLLSVQYILLFFLFFCYLKPFSFILNRIFILTFRSVRELEIESKSCSGNNGRYALIGFCGSTPNLLLRFSE